MQALSASAGGSRLQKGLADAEPPSGRIDDEPGHNPKPIDAEAQRGAGRGHDDGKALSVDRNVAGDDALVLGHPSSKAVGAVEEGSKVPRLATWIAVDLLDARRDADECIGICVVPRADHQGVSALGGEVSRTVP